MHDKNGIVFLEKLKMCKQSLLPITDRNFIHGYDHDDYHLRMAVCSTRPRLIITEEFSSENWWIIRHGQTCSRPLGSRFQGKCACFIWSFSMCSLSSTTTPFQWRQADRPSTVYSNFSQVQKDGIVTKSIKLCSRSRSYLQ